MGRPRANSPVAMGLCVCPPDSLGPVWVACAVWSGQVSLSSLRVSTQCSASWRDGSTRLGLEPTVTTTSTFYIASLEECPNLVRCYKQLFIAQAKVCKVSADNTCP